MVSRIEVELVDDLDGGPADEQVGFSIGQQHYEIDLSAPNAEQFRAQVQPFIEHARRPPHRYKSRTMASRQLSKDMRAWAKDQGMEVSDFGRIAQPVKAAYRAAHSGSLVQAKRIAV